MNELNFCALRRDLNKKITKCRTGQRTTTLNNKIMIYCKLLNITPALHNKSFSLIRPEARVSSSFVPA